LSYKPSYINKHFQIWQLILLQFFYITLVLWEDTKKN
jgi:hypothetical protein